MALSVVATPVGNLRDITLRALDALREADAWVVEDSRRAGRLRTEFDLPEVPMIRYYDEVEERQVDQILERLRSGESLALLCDAGTPMIADPGYDLINAAREAEVEVRPVPGASAPVAALSVSGFPSDEFLFIGFFPRTDKKRRDRLLELKYFPGTVIFFEAPHRLRATLRAVRSYLGSRRLFVAREMTKQFEEYRRGTAGELLEFFGEEPKGEVTVLVHPAEPPSPDPEQYLRELLERGLQLKDAARAAARYTSRTKSDLYREGLGIQEALRESESGSGETAEDP